MFIITFNADWMIEDFTEKSITGWYSIYDNLSAMQWFYLTWMVAVDVNVNASDPVLVLH